MENESTLRIETRTPQRTEVLIANFVNGYAAGWKMYVKESFRDALDIKLLPRVINKKTHMVWTQGDCFNFHKGDIFYSNDKNDFNPVDPYQNALMCVQVQQVSPSGYVDADTIKAIAEVGSITRATQTGKAKPTDHTELVVARLKMDHGSVHFTISKRQCPSEPFKEHSFNRCSQKDFVVFLQTGKLKDLTGSELISTQ